MVQTFEKLGSVAVLAVKVWLVFQIIGAIIGVTFFLFIGWLVLSEWLRNR